MQNSNASIRCQDKIRILFFRRLALLSLAGLFLWAPILHGRPGHANAAPAKPAAPSALTLRITGETRITLAWTDNSNNEEGFQIERRLSTATAFTLVETLGPNFEIFTDTTVARDAKYFYRLRAFNNEGSSNYSNIVDGVTPPKAPGSLTATPVSTKRVALTWKDRSDTEDGFELDRRLATVEAFARIAKLGPNVQTFSDSGLTQNTKYFYRVRTFNASGESEYAAAVSVTTLPTPPLAPTQLIASAVSSSQINLTWQDKSDNETGFKIERASLISPLVFVEIAKTGANLVNFVETGLMPNTTYIYRVRAYNLGGESPFSNEARATTLPTRPLAPSSLTATTLSNTRINLTWQDNATNEDSFKVERASTGSAQGSPAAFKQIAVVGVNVKNFMDSSLTANTKYFYRVRASNRGGHSDYSNEANATTLPNRPATPGNLTAVTASHLQIDLAWQDNATNEDSFRIERALAGSALAFKQIATLAANVKNFSDKTLAPNTEYVFRVRASNRGGHSDYSNLAKAKTFPNPPGAPSDLVATTISNSRISLKWQDNATNEAGFHIERASAGSSSAYKQIALVGANVKQFADSGLVANTLYFYRVRAFNTGNQTGYSNEASATTLPDRPVAPGNLTATAVSNMQIDLAWQDNATNEDSVKIERALTGVASAFKQIATLAANAKNFSDKGLTARTEYFYRVRASNRGGHSDYSNQASAKTFPNPPGAPSNVIATATSNSSIKLSWQDNATNEEGFQIERASASSASTPGAYLQIAIAGVNITQFADSGLASNTLYFYRVRAFNTGNHTDYSNEASVRTLPDKPAAPGNLTATTVSNTQIKLGWQDNATNEDSFKIERGSINTAPGAPVVYKRIATLGAEAKEFLDRGLAANTEYSYRVRASNRGGHSDYSNEARAKTFPNPPAAPGNVTATTVSYHRINLSWKDNAHNEVGFKIERAATDLPDAFVEIAQVGANAVSFADTGLSGNTKYFYRLRAYNTGGPSAYSAMVSSTTLPGPPAAPSQLSATLVIHNRINLTWQDNATNEAGFRIERKIGAAGKFEEIIAVGPNVTSYVNTGLTEKTSYSYRVRAHNAGGFSTYSEILEVTTPPIPPLMPGRLRATAVSHSQINLAWTDSSSNESGFKIERRAGVLGVFAEIAKVDANIAKYADSSLAGNTIYFYRVRAFNDGGHSGYSNEARATTLPKPPAAPANLSAVLITDNLVNLAWQDNAVNEAGYRIERKIGAAGKYEEIIVLGANATNYSNTSLTEKTPYFYRVRAFNAGGFSGYSNVLEATTLPISPDSPGNLLATAASNTQINLTWQDRSTNEDSFEIERKLGAAGTYAELTKVGANVTNYADKNLTGNTIYFYRVRTFNAGGHSDYSNEASAATLPNPPAAPANLTATTVNRRQINLTWQDKSSNEDSFKIERKMGNSPAGQFMIVASVGANVKNFADTSLAANTAYFYRVRAYNRGGFSGYSNEARAVTLPLAPAAPRNLLANAAGARRINLAWVDSSNNEVVFEIERRLSTTAFTKVATVAANISSYADSNLAVNTVYFYRVRGLNTGGFSGYSNEASATTWPLPPTAPGDLAATTVSNAQINLTWQDNSANEDSFKIERASANSLAGSPMREYKQIALVGAEVNSFADTALAADTRYFYRVRAYNRGGHSDYSNEAHAATLPNRPGTPANLTATAKSNKRIDLAWQDLASNEDGFKIERKLKSVAAFVEVAKVGPNVTSYSDQSVGANAVFIYRVRAFNNGGHSDYSNEAGTTTLPNLPNPPGQLTASTVSNTQINLKWLDNSANEDSFKVERGSTSSPQGSAGVTYQLIAVLRANASSFADTGLAANRRYFYRVRASNRGGHSAYSNEAEATTLPNRPETPANLTATTRSNQRIDLAWQDLADNEDGFAIERASTGSAGAATSSPLAFVEIAKVGSNVTSYADSTVTEDAPYSYRVRAFNAGGFSNYSNEANATTLPNLPGAPSQLAATTVSNKQIDLQWQDNAVNENGFKVERRLAEAPSEAYSEIAVVGAEVNHFADTTLAANTRYAYRLRAYNRAGHSAYSNEANAATLPNRPEAPENLTATTKSNKRIDLTWKDLASNEDGFKIERRSKATAAYTELVKVGPNVTSYSDLNLEANAMYFYRVRAFNAGGHSAYSNEANTATLPNLPSPPSQLTATTVSNRQIDLKWQDTSTNEDSFKIERSLASSPHDSTGAAPGPYKQIAVVGAAVNSFADTALAANTRYFYRVRAYNRAGHSAYSNEANAATLPNRPGVPANLTATTKSNKRIDLAWQDQASNEDGFKIERRSKATEAFTEVAKVGPNVTSYSDFNLSANTPYFYRVRAFNAGGHTDYSNEASATTLPNLPAAPGLLTATTVSNKQIDLKWQDNSANEDSFKVERGSAGSLPIAAGAPIVYKQIAVLRANAKSFADTALAANTPYSYRVRAYNRAGHSEYSNEATAATLPNPPAAPANLTATAKSNSRIDLAWQDMAANEDSFKIERASASSPQTFVEVARVGPNATKYSDPNLAVNTSYFYRVRAINAGGHSAYSNEAGATTLPNLPGAPTQLIAATVSNRQIDLTWEDRATDEDSFKVERGSISAPGAPVAYKQIAALRANTTGFSDTTLAANTSYLYRVRAYNRAGHSGYSNPANAITLPNPPAAPSTLVANTISNTQINLSWQDKSGNEAGFRIERKMAVTDTYVEIGKVAANVTNYSDNSLEALNTYFYRVRAFNAGGTSSYTNEAFATTRPNPPANPRELTATPVSNKQIDLSWLDSSVDEDSFKIERRQGTAGKYKIVGAVGANSMNFSDAGLAPNTLYFYRIRAMSAGGFSAYSNEANATTLPNAPTSPVSLKAAVISHVQIKLTWSDSASNKIGFRIERKINGSVYAVIDTVGANAVSYQDNGLNPDTEYFYRVRTYNAGGQSAPSNEVSARTLPTPPAPPVNLTALAVSGSQVDLAWADSSNNESGFKIERRTALGNFVEVATTGPNVTRYANVDLNSNTRYFYRVRAFNRGNLSAYSNVAEVLTLAKPPAEPQNLVATTRVNLQINLAWVDNSSSEDSFKIERKLGKTGVYVQIAAVGRDVVNYADVNLQPVTQYFYRVRAVNPGGPSAYSNEAGATTLVRPPVGPKNLMAITISNTRIRLAWEDSSNNETGFQIERRSASSPTGASGEYKIIAKLGPNVKSLVDSSLSGGSEYFYRARAYNVGGHSDYSNEAVAQTLLDPPLRPTSLTATPLSTTAIKLAWLDHATNEAGYYIERKLSSAGTTETYALVATTGPNVKSFIDSSLTLDTGYAYRVRAFNSGGKSNFSNEANVRTLPNLPAAPSNLSATVASARKVNLTWSDNSTNETGFQIERKTGATGEYGEIGVVSANVKRFTDSTVVGKTDYFYRVRSYNAAGGSDYTNEESVTTLPNAPLPPTNLTINTVTYRLIKLTWSDNSVNESGFRIERRATLAGTYTVVAAVGANVITFTDTTLSALTPYYYRVYGFNTGGASNYSNVASATTLPNPPAKPDSLIATAMNHLQIKLMWKDLSDNEAGFQIERKIGAGGKFSQIASVGAGVTNYFDSNLAGNREYFYRVRAFNAGGLSNYSNEVKSMTLPIPPGSLTGGSLSNRRLYIVWTDSSNNESGFRIERRLFETDFQEIGFVGTNVRSYADSNLTPNTVYYYRVRAFNFGGFSGYSNEAAVATLPNAPARPRGLSVKRLPNLRLGLAWVDSATNEVGFAVERKLSTDTAFVEVSIVNANVSTFIDTGLVAETRYFYRVRGFNTGGYSPYSNEANNLTLGAPPVAPGELSATSGGSTKINLLWQDFSSNESGFKIERKLLSDTVYTEIASVGADITSYSDNQVSKETAYLYRVRAFNEGGISTYTNEATATPSNDINLAVGKPAVASSVDIVGTAGRVVDGNLTTFWRSDTVTATKPQVWLRVELSPTAQIVVDRVVIRWQQNYFATAFEIQTSDNGLHWTTIYATEAGKAGAQEIFFAQTPARFVRLYMKRNNKANYRVTEFEVYSGLAKAGHTSSADEASIPTTVTLQPNYPNPFNPATTISFGLPEGRRVTLKVINVAGQEVATLVHGYRERGMHRVSFNGRKLPSGAYFAVLQAGDVRQVRQMLLAK